MKLLVVASTFPHGGSDPVPGFVRDQLIALQRARPHLRITVLAPHDKRSSTRDFTRWPEYDEYRFHYFWPFSLERLAGRGILPALASNRAYYLLVPFLFAGEFLALLSLTRRLKPDVIYAHWFTPQGVTASLVSKLTGTPFVFTTHASDVDVWRKVPWLGGIVVRRCVGRARAITSVSQRSLQRLLQFIAPGDRSSVEAKSAVIPMGVDVPHPASLTSKASNRCFRFLFLGRLVEKKGIEFLLRAYATALSQIGESEMVIAGDGPLKAQLQEQAAALGLAKRVIFPGFASASAKTALLESADALVVPSIITSSGDAEGLPVSLMEGLSYGKICIATAESGAGEILVNGVDGLVVPQRDDAALAAALMEAAFMDQDRRQAMGAAAQRSARQFDWPTIADRHYDFLFAQFNQEAV